MISTSWLATIVVFTSPHFPFRMVQRGMYSCLWSVHCVEEQPRYHVRILLVPLGKLWTEGPWHCAMHPGGWQDQRNLLDNDKHYSKIFWLTACMFKIQASMQFPVLWAKTISNSQTTVLYGLMLETCRFGCREVSFSKYHPYQNVPTSSNSFVQSRKGVHPKITFGPSYLSVLPPSRRSSYSKSSQSKLLKSSKVSEMVNKCLVAVWYQLDRKWYGYKWYKYTRKEILKQISHESPTYLSHPRPTCQRFRSTHQSPELASVLGGFTQYM